MKTVISSALQQAKQLVRAQNVIEATRVMSLARPIRSAMSYPRPQKSMT